MRKSAWAVAACLLATAALGFTACGDDDDDGGGGGGGAGERRIDQGRHRRPGHRTTPSSSRPSRPSRRCSSSTRRSSPTSTRRATPAREIDPRPGRGLPEVTNGGKTYKFKLRSGLKYSDGTPVKASDFENTIKRLLELEGPYSLVLHRHRGRGRVPGEGRQQGRHPRHRDRRRDRRDHGHPRRARQQVPVRARPRPYAAPTPAAKSPIKSLTKNPPPGVGPYMIKVVDPSREFVLTKNPNFDVPGHRRRATSTRSTAYVTDNVPKMTQDVITGSSTS